MFKQAILATATAGLIAAGGLAVTASAASADPYWGGPGWNGPHVQIQIYPQRSCRPVIKNVKWWDRFGYPHWRQIVVAQTCDFYGQHPHPHPYPGPHQGW